jgi:multiple sugar transport system permease protein
MKSKGINLRTGISKVLHHLFLGFLSIVVLLPIVWTFSTSIKDKSLITRTPPVLIPPNMEFGNYIDVFRRQPFGRYILNTLIDAGGAVLLGALFGTLAAYAFSRYEFRGKNVLFGAVLFTLLVPGLTNLIPLYGMMTSWGLLDSYTAMILLLTPGMLPFTILIMRNFFDSIPKELEEAAAIDGCNTAMTLWKVIVPLAAPGLVAVVLINFVGGWNDFFINLIFTSSTEMKTITSGLYNFIGVSGTNYGDLAAAAFIGMIPLIVLFLLLRERFMTGMLEGSVKG